MITRFLCLAITHLYVACAFGGEIPKPEWRPGYYGQPREVRLSPDGRLLTVVSAVDLKIIDLQNMTCTFIDDYALLSPLRFDRYQPSRYAAVNASGDLVVTSDTNGIVTWRRVADTSVVSITNIPRYRYARVGLIDDTLAYVSQRDSGYVISVTGRSMRIKYSARPINLNDKLGALVNDTISYVVDLTTHDTTAALRGKYLGMDARQRLYLFADSYVIRYDVRDAFSSDTVMYEESTPDPIIRNRFLPTRDSLIDLSDDSRHRTILTPDDMLPDHTAVDLDRARGRLILSISGGDADTTAALDGPILYIAQDPRDSAVFIQTSNGSSLLEYGALGRYGIVTDSTLHIGGETTITGFGPPMFIRGSLSSSFSSYDQTCFFGYINLDSIRQKRTWHSISIMENFAPNEGSRPSYAFSADGDTLRRFKQQVDFNQCPTDTMPDGTSGAMGFISGTPFYVVGRNKYDMYDCSAQTLLPHTVASVSPYRDRVVFRSEDSLFLGELTNPDRHYAAASIGGTRTYAWSDSGTTVRIIRENAVVISLHSNGSVDSVLLPVYMASLHTHWHWSHDGMLLTGIKNDTLATVDVRTGAVLREYYNAYWLVPANPENGSGCRVGASDGRLIVSLPSGCYATLPGITLPTISSVTHDSPFQPLQLHGTRIVGAAPQSHVVVYSLVGAVALESIVDASGTLDLADKGLPHGAFVVAYMTAEGMRMTRILR